MTPARPATRPRPRSRATWADYERLKRAWTAAHPGATPNEYEQAMQRIARDLRL